MHGVKSRTSARRHTFSSPELIRDVVAPRFANVRTTQVAHAGHWPHVEQPAAVAHILTRFLRALATRMSRPVPNTNHTERLGK